MPEVRRVLLVDDDQAYNDLVESHYMSGSGHEIVSVNSVEQAVEQISDAWAVILLDLNIPPYTGFEALRTLRASAPNAPIVVLTDGDPSSLEVEAIRAGADSSISKAGLSPESLQHSVRCAVARHEESSTRDRAAELLSGVLVAITALSTTVTRQADRTRLRGPIELGQAFLDPELRSFAIDTVREILFKVLIPALAAGAAGGFLPALLGGGGS